MSDDVHVEPQRGLPEALPEGERIIWQGAPDWRALAVEVFHVRAVIVYGALLILWRTATVLHDGGSMAEAAIVALWLLALPVGACAILAILAYATASTTVYTITDKRVVMRIGIALTLTLNLPFRRIVSADYKPGRRGTGEIALSTAGTDRVSFLVLWPHSRPWRVRKPQPMLRAVPEGQRVAALLARALAGASQQSVRKVESAPGHAPAARGTAARPAALAS